jgi:hypothetical protein
MVEDLAAQLARGADLANLLGSVYRYLALLCGRRGSTRLRSIFGYFGLEWVQSPGILFGYLKNPNKI